MKKRAERFGTSVAPSLTAVEDNERKQKRRERFGLATADLPTDVCTKIHTTCECGSESNMLSPSSGQEESQVGALRSCQLNFLRFFSA